MHQRIMTRSTITQSPNHLITKIAAGTIVVFAVLALPMIASACPMCKEALFEPGQLHQKLSTAKGYALSIGLLLLVPTGLIASVTALILRASRREKNFPQPSTSTK